MAFSRSLTVNPIWPMSLNAHAVCSEFMPGCYPASSSENFFKTAFLSARQTRGDTPTRRVNHELKLPKLSKPIEKQISVTGSSLCSRRNFARSTRQADRYSWGVIRKTALNPRKKWNAERQEAAAISERVRADSKRA